MTALHLRNHIKDIDTPTPWPPTAEHLTLRSAEAVVPAKLYNFLAWVIGASDDPNMDNKVDVKKSSTHRKLLSISQDVISLASSGHKLMPKQTSLAMAVRHLSGSAQLIGLLNGFGHSVSHSVVLNHDTALTKQEMMRGEDAVPSNIAGNSRCASTTGPWLEDRRRRTPAPDSVMELAHLWAVV